MDDARRCLLQGCQFCVVHPRQSAIRHEQGPRPPCRARFAAAACRRGLKLEMQLAESLRKGGRTRPSQRLKLVIRPQHRLPPTTYRLSRTHPHIQPPHTLRHRILVVNHDELISCFCVSLTSVSLLYSRVQTRLFWIFQRTCCAKSWRHAPLESVSRPLRQLTSACLARLTRLHSDPAPHYSRYPELLQLELARWISHDR